jgi:hypothetical protein
MSGGASFRMVSILKLRTEKIGRNSNISSPFYNTNLLLKGLGR